MIYIYVALGLVIGAASERLRSRWTALASSVVFLGGLLVDTWRYIDWQRGGVFETLSTGLMWNFVPLVLLFLVPFVCGKYTLRGVRKLLGRRRATVEGR